jgi:hypothetical protein
MPILKCRTLLSAPRELGIFTIVLSYEISDEKEVSIRGRKAVKIMAEALCEEFIHPVSTVDPFPRDLKDLLPGPCKCREML